MLLSERRCPQAQQTTPSRCYLIDLMVRSINIFPPRKLLIKYCFAGLIMKTPSRRHQYYRHQSLSS